MHPYTSTKCWLPLKRKAFVTLLEQNLKILCCMRLPAGETGGVDGKLKAETVAHPNIWS